MNQLAQKRSSLQSCPLWRREASALAALVLAFSLVPATSHAQAPSSAVRLTVGESFTARVRGTVTKVQVLNPAVADVATYSGRSATIVGVSAGTTELLVFTTRRRHKYSVVVTRVESSRLFKQVKRFLGRIEGIYVSLVGDAIVINGAALTADDFGRAQRAVDIFGNKVKNLVAFKESAVQQVSQIFKRNGLTDVRARLIGGSVFLEGSVGSKAEMNKVGAILRSYGLRAENLIREGGGKQVLIDVEFVELRKSAQERIGVTWPSVYGVASVDGTLQATIPIQPSGQQRQISVNVSAPIQLGRFAVEALYNSGNARLLAQPKLVCGSGRAAEFLVGGEVPIIVVNQNVVNVDFKSYGIKLNVKPTADSMGNIRTDIFAEVSEPDYSVQVQNIPGFRTRRFKTFVTVKDGASIVLSGLFSNAEQKGVTKLPLLGHIPILGELFKSRDFVEQKTTLVVFVTPRVVSARHPWVGKSIRDIQKLYGDYKAEVGWKVFD